MIATIFYNNNIVTSIDSLDNLIYKIDEAKEIWIKFEWKNSEKIEQLLNEINNLQRFYVLKPFKITIEHGDSVVGKKLANKAANIEKHIIYAWITKSIVTMHAKIHTELCSIYDKLNEINYAK